MKLHHFSFSGCGHCVVDEALTRATQAIEKEHGSDSDTFKKASWFADSFSKWVDHVRSKRPAWAAFTPCSLMIVDEQLALLRLGVPLVIAEVDRLLPEIPSGDQRRANLVDIRRAAETINTQFDELLDGFVRDSDVGWIAAPYQVGGA